MIKRNLYKFLWISAFFAVSSNASDISITNLDKIEMGAKIVGPVGPEVEVSLIDKNGDSLGDLTSSVSCPEDMDECIVSKNPSGTIYTYQHTVIPGVDKANDKPFPNPETVINFENVKRFSLGFEASGFNGVAGYSYTAAQNAKLSFEVHQSSTGELVWTISSGAWDTGEAITFFWQTSQAPSGPGGKYNASNADNSATGRGPLPRPIESTLATQVPAPVTFGMLVAGILWLFARDRRAIKK
ncbi:exosortase, PEP-CTERM interaction domain protein [Glaciecola petra]|uniref:Exosortase, PEP-CTERM interaction domain protein n=1 Tax=Glaciecola petra TaxID=3075602 RepID=A0ABU2ZUK4_9ALTE|nr:exosortase, PEP-CTERM interaction domain protein [Aestuariibacter sp. P117]MDT0596323.1 exosortase, PEP-CTERM interaction domain protein [Aestuariibacter sp. P117]